MASGVSGYGNLAGYDDGLGILPLVATVAAPAAQNFFSSLLNQHPKDAQRIATAQSNLQKALAGDANAYLLLQQQAGLIPGYGSATQVGKDAAKQALDYYAQAKGAQPPAPVSMSPVIAPASVAVAPAVTTGVNPNVDTGAPVLTRADVGGAGGGVSPALLIGVGLAAAMAFKKGGR